MSKLTQLTSYQSLKHYFETQELPKLKALFQTDNKRFENFSLAFEDIFLDYSKNAITPSIFSTLIQLAHDMQLSEAIQALFRGEKLNETEERAVLHTALRSLSNTTVNIDEKNIIHDVHQELSKVKQISEDLINQKHLGYTDKPITDIVNIGIGGSDFGPRMVYKALTPYHNHLNVHFVSNIDANDLLDILEKCDTETTVFIIVSKSFTTQETITNAHTARSWFLETAQNEIYIQKHFIAISSNTKAVQHFGIAPNNCLKIWNWVGGRYSLWSAVGLSVACGVGYNNFEKLLAGAFAMDEHFRHAPFDKNMPVILGMLGVLYNNFLKTESYAILPYAQHLELFVQHIQQLAMESNGKNKNKKGQLIDYQSDAVAWGGVGTNSQHAFFQLLHQGTKYIPCDFIAIANPHHSLQEHHEILLANCFAQTEALMMGKSEKQVVEELRKQGKSSEEIKKLVPFKLFEGNKPSTTILLKTLNPYNLGSLIALYEHKTFVQGVVWDVFSFDQWGVELGKQLAKSILPELSNTDNITTHDASTNGLINAFKAMKNK